MLSNAFRCVGMISRSNGRYFAWRKIGLEFDAIDPYVDPHDPFPEDKYDIDMKLDRLDATSILHRNEDIQEEDTPFKNFSFEDSDVAARVRDDPILSHLLHRTIDKDKDTDTGQEERRKVEWSELDYVVQELSEKLQEFNGPLKVAEILCDRHEMKNDDIALVCDTIESRYLVPRHELMKLSKRIATFFKTKMHVKRGDIVACILPPGKKLVASFLACTRIGAIFMPIDVACGRTRVQQCLLANPVKALIVLDTSYCTIRDLLPDFQDLPDVLEEKVVSASLERQESRIVGTEVREQFAAEQYLLSSDANTPLPGVQLDPHAFETLSHEQILERHRLLLKRNKMEGINTIINATKNTVWVHDKDPRQHMIDAWALKLRSSGEFPFEILIEDTNATGSVLNTVKENVEKNAAIHRWSSVKQMLELREGDEEIMHGDDVLAILHSNSPHGEAGFEVSVKKALTSAHFYKTDVLGTSESDDVWHTADAVSNGEYLLNVISHLLSGHKLFQYYSSKRPKEMLDFISSTHVNGLVANSTELSFLVNAPTAEKVQHAGLRFICTSGFISSNLAALCKRWFHCDLTWQYTKDECGVLACNFLGQRFFCGPYESSFVGSAMIGIRMVVLDSEGNEAPIDRPGELVVDCDVHASPLWWLSKYKYPQSLNDAKFVHVGSKRYWKTGDFAICDRFGRFHIKIDNEDTSIIHCGTGSIRAVDVENAIRRHHWTKDAAVIGVQDATRLSDGLPMGGYIPKAYVLLRKEFDYQKRLALLRDADIRFDLSDSEPDLKKITREVKGLVSLFVDMRAVPFDVYFVERLPLLADGSTDYQALQLIAENDESISARARIEKRRAQNLDDYYMWDKANDPKFVKEVKWYEEHALDRERFEFSLSNELDIDQIGRFLKHGRYSSGAYDDLLAAQQHTTPNLDEVDRIRMQRLSMFLEDPTTHPGPFIINEDGNVVNDRFKSMKEGKIERSGFVPNSTFVNSERMRKALRYNYEKLEHVRQPWDDINEEEITLHREFEEIVSLLNEQGEYKKS